MAKKDTEQESDRDADEEVEETSADEEEDEDRDADDEDEDEASEEDDDDERDDDDEEDLPFGDEPLGQRDAFWWTPHLVLFLLLLVGMLGFFGLFNPWLGHLAPGASEDAGGEDAAAPAGSSTAQVNPAATSTPSSIPRPVPTLPATAARAPDTTVYGARHILVQYVGVRGQKPSVERTRAEAADRAEKVAGEAKKTKDVRPESERVKAFTALVDKYSDEPNAPQTRGDLGRFRDNAYEAKLVAGVKRLPVGDVSDPVESPFGFHVIWRTL